MTSAAQYGLPVGLYSASMVASSLNWSHWSAWHRLSR